jgi:hypothetical protein
MMITVTGITEGGIVIVSIIIFNLDTIQVLTLDGKGNHMFGSARTILDGGVMETAAGINRIIRVTESCNISEEKYFRKRLDIR